MPMGTRIRYGKPPLQPPPTPSHSRATAGRRPQSAKLSDCSPVLLFPPLTQRHARTPADVRVQSSRWCWAQVSRNTPCKEEED